MIIIKSIKDDEDYKNALKAINDLWDAEAGTKDSETLNDLIELVDEYESKRFHFY